MIYLNNINNMCVMFITCGMIRTIMATLRDWLQLFRSHTSPLEVSITVMGGALGLGTFWDLRILIFALLGWLYHNAGYGQNSIEDYARGYDRSDPNKAHHPLQRSVIDIHTGRLGVNLLLGTMLALFFVLLFNNPIGLLLMLSMVALGLVYNYFGKGMSFKFIPIALAHSLLFPVSYLAAGGYFSFSLFPPFFLDVRSWVAFLGFSYFAFQIVYQILIEGDLKDIGMDEATMLDRLGIRLEGQVFRASAVGRFVGFLIKFMNILIAGGIVVLLGPTPLSVALWLLMSALMIVFDHRLLRTRVFVHSETLKDMALMEVISVFTMILVMAPTFGPDWWGYGAAFLLIVLDMAYFAIMNRYLWGTLIKPRV